MARTRLAILISGRGSNMSALIDAAENPAYPASIVGVLSNRAGAPGLAIAEARGLPTSVCPHASYPGREAFEAALEEHLRAWDTELVALAGFMRLLTPSFVERWLGKIVNIHPALLPAFKGLDTHARALAAGATEHGCTVHFVTPGMDEGPVIDQALVPVLPGDTAETLAARVLVEENRLYPLAVARVARGEARLKA